MGRLGALGAVPGDLQGMSTDAFVFSRRVLKFETIDCYWDGIGEYCKPENKVSLGFVEGLNNKIGVIQCGAYGLRDEEYLRLKVLTCMLPKL